MNQYATYDVSLWIVAAMFLPAALYVYRLGAVQRGSAAAASASAPSEQIKDFDSFIAESFDEEENAHVESNARRHTSWREWLLVLAGATYLLFYVGTEIGAGGFIDSFGVTRACLLRVVG